MLSRLLICQAFPFFIKEKKYHHIINFVLLKIVLVLSSYVIVLSMHADVKTAMLVLTSRAFYVTDVTVWLFIHNEVFLAKCKTCWTKASLVRSPFKFNKTTLTHVHCLWRLIWRMYKLHWYLKNNCNCDPESE